jgi:arylsulfatase A-like enzyme
VTLPILQKFTNWEAGVRVPLIIRDPYIPQSHGKKSAALVELVDVMPTLAQLAGVALPGDEDKLDGLVRARLPFLRCLLVDGWSRR